MTHRSQLSRVAAPLRQQVTELIRELILSNELEPGERIVEKVLCGRFDVSRTVVREALRQLEAEQLITIVANRGPVVTIIRIDEAVAIYDVREVLEALAGRLFAVRASPSDRTLLLAAFDEIARITDEGSLDDELAAKDKFYDALLDGAHNEVIRSTLRSLHARIRVLRRLSLQAPGRQPETLRELEAIIEATVKRPDPLAAWQACEAHVRAASAVALARLRQIEDSDDVPALRDVPGDH
jgi:DNA-binding GntR family transcriptional regulator